MTPDNATRRNIYFPDDLWQRITKAAGKEQARTGEAVTVSEWVRQACEDRLTRNTKGE